jgi:hypothetical protein
MWKNWSCLNFIWDDEKALTTSISCSLKNNGTIGNILLIYGTIINHILIVYYQW